MKNVKKLAALGVGILMTSSLFAGCSTDGVALSNAFAKSQTINSMQTKTDISLKVSAINLSAKEKQMTDILLPMLNSSIISMSTKINQNQERTSGKVQEDFSIQFGQIPINMSVWADTDLIGDKPKINEIIKMPRSITAQLPQEFQNRDYMVMNLSDMNNEQGMPQIDYKKLMSFREEFQPKLLYFASKYQKQFNPDAIYISQLRENTYELKLSDRSLKELMHYTLNNLSKNPDAINFVSSYMSAAMSIYDITDKNAQINKVEMNKALIDLTNNLPEKITNLNKALEYIDNLKILGDDGITIIYTLNKDGYIVKENGNAQFVVDLPNIIKLASSSASENSSSTNPTGIYTINLGFNTDITNINGDVDIVFPQVDASNSFNYNDLMKSIPAQSPDK